MTTSKTIKGAALAAGVALMTMTAGSAFAASATTSAPPPAPKGHHMKLMAKCQAMGPSAMSNRRCARLMKKEQRSMMKQQKKATKGSS